MNDPSVFGNAGKTSNQLVQGNQQKPPEQKYPNFPNQQQPQQTGNDFSRFQVYLSGFQTVLFSLYVGKS